VRRWNNKDGTKITHLNTLSLSKQQVWNQICSQWACPSELESESARGMDTGPRSAYSKSYDELQRLPDGLLQGITLTSLYKRSAPPPPIVCHCSHNPEARRPYRKRMQGDGVRSERTGEKI
jgi:hypothetical protein